MIVCFSNENIDKKKGNVPAAAATTTPEAKMLLIYICIYIYIYADIYFLSQAGGNGNNKQASQLTQKIQFEFLMNFV